MPSTRSAERRVEAVWGTVVTIDVREPVEPALLDDVVAWFHEVDDRFSTWRPGTEISRLGRGELSLADASDDVREVLDRCDRVRADTWGAFDVNVAADPRVAPREGFAPIDPSGLVKGWALDRAAALLEAGGVAHFAVNAGGDVVVRGAPWRVGIQHPHRPDGVACTISVHDGGIATSGRYERGDHVIDPRSGAPATALLAATVVLPGLATADGIATGLLALGADAGRWMAAHPDVAALTIDADDVVTTTPAFDRLRVT